MPTLEKHGDLEFVIVDVDRIEEAVGSIKETLPGEESVCARCEYEAATYRWGVKVYDTNDPGRAALVLCCPSCETHVDLDLDSV